MNLLEQVRGKIRAALDERSEKQDALDAIVATLESEERDATAEENEAFVSARDAIVALDEEIKALQDRENDLADLEARKSAAAGVEKRIGGAPRVEVTSEPATYSAYAERSGVFFLSDVANAHSDPAAAQRLARHQAETRDVGTGAFAGLVVPQYLTDLVAPLRRAGRPVADICNKHVLPADGMTVNISRITTGTAAAAQATETNAVQETNIDDTLLTVNVRTIAGQQDVSRQALDRGVGVQEIVLADLVADYNTKLDNSILNDDGTSGTHLGIRSTSSIISVTYTSGSPTAAGLYPKLADLIQQAQAGSFLGITHFIMHPRRWWWLAKEVGSTFPFLSIPGVGTNQAGNLGGTDYEGTNRSILGIPVVLDGNMRTNLGAGTEDVIIGVTADELHLWEEANAPLYIRTENVGALSVNLQVYGYTAFTAGRYPASHGVIGGTGLIAPTF